MITLNGHPAQCVDSLGPYRTWIGVVAGKNAERLIGGMLYVCLLKRAQTHVRHANLPLL